MIVLDHGAPRDSEIWNLSLAGPTVPVKGSSAAEAFQNIEKYSLPHLALVDIMMPDIDGLEFCRKVHEYCDLPVIMLTAVSEQGTTAQAIREVAEDYVVKPFRQQDLLARIERLLRRVGDFSYTLAPQIVIDDQLVVDFANHSLTVKAVETALRGFSPHESARRSCWLQSHRSQDAFLRTAREFSDRSGKDWFDRRLRR